MKCSPDGCADEDVGTGADDGTGTIEVGGGV